MLQITLDADVRRVEGKQFQESRQEEANPIQLICLEPNLNVHELRTVLEVLQMVPEEIGLSEGAAAWLQMEFSETRILHESRTVRPGAFYCAIRYGWTRRKRTS